MGIKVFFSNQLEQLADELSTRLISEAKEQDPFKSQHIIVPNPNVKKWLQLEIATRNGICSNVKVDYLQAGIWALCRDFIPEKERNSIHLLSTDQIQLFILHILNQAFETAGSIAPELELFAYNLFDADGTKKANFSQKLWQLSNRLALYFREYENHRPEMCQAWLTDRLRHPKSAEDPDIKAMELAQKHLYRLIFSYNGIIERIEKKTGKAYKTISQFCDYALKNGKLPDTPVIHIFSLTQVSTFMNNTLLQLSRHMDIHMYQMNVCSEFWEDLDTEAEERWKRIKNREASMNTEGEEELEPDDEENDLLKYWGKTGREQLKLLSTLEDRMSSGGEFESYWIHHFEEHAETNLQRVQQQVLQRQQSPDTLFPQDQSLQIFRSPDIVRELETVYNTIIHNLKEDPQLNQSDIAIFVCDIKLYKPAIHSVFDKHPQLISYNLSDSSAEVDSVYGQAVKAFLELIYSDFTRRDLFELFYNPCFIAAADIDRATVDTWLNWTEELGIFHSFNQDEKDQSGADPNSLYTWEQGLKRLRLGRIMSREYSDDEFVHYKELVPYEDLESSDATQIEKFSYYIEAIYHDIKRIKQLEHNYQNWISELENIFTKYLDIPDDRPGEMTVRDKLHQDFKRLSILDHIEDGSFYLSHDIIKEYIVSRLSELSSRHGSFLAGGVNICALRPYRAIPFKVVYILGLGERIFPGHQDYSSLDLRKPGRFLGDISKPDDGRYAFLETLISCRDKLYLSYLAKNMKKDQNLHPSSVIIQLQNYLAKYITGEKYRLVDIPVKRSDWDYFREQENWHNLLVNFDTRDHLSALDELLHTPSREINETLFARLKANEMTYRQLIKKHSTDFNMAVAGEHADLSRNLCLDDLYIFLSNPVEALIRKVLKIHEWELNQDDLSLVEDEPFYSSKQIEREFSNEILNHWVEQSSKKRMAVDTDTLVKDYHSSLYEAWQRKSRMPDSSYSVRDSDNLIERILERVHGQGKVKNSLAYELKKLNKGKYYHNVVIGDSKSNKAIDLKLNSPVLDYGAFNVTLHASLNNLWVNPSSGSLEALIIDDYVQAGHKVLPQGLLRVYIFYLILLQTDNAEELLPSGDLTVYFSSRYAINKYRYSIKKEKAYLILYEMIRDFYSEAIYDNLPYSVIRDLDTESLGKPFQPKKNATEKEKVQYARRLESHLEDELENPFSNYYPSEVLRMIRGKVPTDAWDKIQKRFSAFFY